MKKIISFICISFLLLTGCSQKEKNTEPQIPEIILNVSAINNIIGGIFELSAEIVESRESLEVSFYCDGNFIGMSYQNPYSISWDTNSVDDGEHILTCILDTDEGFSISPEVPVTVLNTIFTITVEDSYLDDHTVFVLLSTEDGMYIDHEVFTSAQTYEFAFNESIQYNGYLNITYGYFTDYDYRRITTRNSIPLGRHWTLFNTVIDRNNNIDAVFENVPENQGYLFTTSTTYETDNDVTLEEGVMYSIDGRIEFPQVYLGLECLDGYKYKWWESFPASPVDLSVMENAAEINLQFADFGNTIDYFFRGFLDETDFYSYIFLGKDYNLDLRNEFVLHYPPGKFDMFNTSLTLYEDSGDLYYYSYYGEMIDQIDFLEADFSFTEVTDTGFTIVPTGNIDIIYSYWSVDYMGWWMYGPPEIHSQNFPEFPDELLELLSINSLEVYTLGSVSVCDYANINTYEESWQILCESYQVFASVAREYNVRARINPNTDRHSFSAEIISPDEFDIK